MPDIKWTSSNEEDVVARMIPVLNRLRNQLGLEEVKPGQMTLTEIVRATDDAREKLLLREADHR